MKKLKLSDFDYELPEKLIAQIPQKDRGESKLLVLNQIEEKIEDKKISDIVSYFKKGDVLVRNNTKVIPARLFGRKTTGAEIEILLEKNISPEENIWETITSPAKKLKIGSKIIFSENLSAKVLEKNEEIVVLKFCSKNFYKELEKIGKIPLPKYIKNEVDDFSKYQTIYAKDGKSVAAPTSGLHFNQEIFQKLKEKGVEILDINLNIGLGTFAPVWYEEIEKHKMHSEDFYIQKEVAEKINLAKREKRRIFALGTTSVRALESAWDEKNQKLKYGYFETNIFIKPGYQFKVIDNLITNFHLPKSTLLMLVSALAGREKILNAYKYAIEKEYLFFSFGDAMLILEK